MGSSISEVRAAVRILVVMALIVACWPNTSPAGIAWSLIHEAEGDTAEDWLGYSSAWVGDIDGDGHSDFAVGATLADPDGRTNAGSAYVYSGIDGSLIYQKDGENAGDWFGTSIAGIGDVDGDSILDFAIGAVHYDSVGVNPDPGAVYIYSGDDGSLLARIVGSYSGALRGIGQDIVSIGDVDSDDVPDFVVGAPASKPSSFTAAGAVAAYSGESFSQLYVYYGPRALMRLGWSVAAFGRDVNGDGSADFVAGAPDDSHTPNQYEHGSIIVFNGDDGTTLHYEAGVTSSQHFGTDVATIEDINDDGLTDFIVGAPGAIEGAMGGKAYVFRYTTAAGLQYSIQGSVTSGEFGSSVSGMGDFDNDGEGDFVVGASAADRIYIYSGDGTGTLMVTDSMTAGSAYGYSVSGGGDLNSDGAPDIVAGARTYTDGGYSERGYVRVLSGCVCLHHGDPIADGVADDWDIDFTIGVVFWGDPDIVDEGCPHIGRSDHNCDCNWTIQDVVYITNHVRRGGPAPCNPCASGNGCP